ncbi:hypothetical protein JB92DRAFT_3144994 [Gautieria morchelliformis]|nr:hypothetical protein JB92DRAFT_3144994 [Gautieria morchelliformis]
MAPSLSLKERIALYDKSKSAPVSAAVSPSAVDDVTVVDLAASVPVVSDPARVRSISPSPTPDPLVSPAPSLDPPPLPLIDTRVTAPCRPNEHLAVLLPRHLWKQDKFADICDRFACSTKFSLWERRHHCRKCGGIYCTACSTHTTPLLDTTSLPFTFLPKNVPVSAFAAPNAPVVEARICDECFNQLQGYPNLSPRSSPTAKRAHSTSLPEARPSLVRPSSASTLAPGAYPATPPDGRPIPPLHRSQSAAAALSAHATTSAAPQVPPTPAPTPGTDTPSPDAAASQTFTHPADQQFPRLYPHAQFPLKAKIYALQPPARTQPRWDGRTPDGRIRWEVEAEQMEEDRRRRRENPVLIDGEIRVRKLRPPPPLPKGGPYKLPTF